MDDNELDALCERVSTWDQSELDRLLGPPAIEYARKQERDVRQIADFMWDVFPMGPRWWKIRKALKLCRKKASAIHARADEIGRHRASGRIVERYGRLVDLERQP